MSDIKPFKLDIEVDRLTMYCGKKTNTRKKKKKRRKKKEKEEKEE